MSANEKLDLCKKHKEEYVKPKKPVLVNVKPALYLTVTGRGSPSSDEFQAKIGAVYGVAYTIKFAKKAAGHDYKVSQLEGLYWGRRKGASIDGLSKDQWNWQLMSRVPTFVTQDDLAKAIESLIEKGKAPEARSVKLETIDEGQCVQVLHVGPYDQEGVTIELMNTFVQEQGLSLHANHHEIYLSDPRRVPPERMRTILRHPVR